MGGEDPLEKGRQPTPVLLPGRSYEQRSLVGYGPWASKELDITEATLHACTHTDPGSLKMYVLHQQAPQHTLRNTVTGDICPMLTALT